jgi:hypothetical protein
MPESVLIPAPVNAKIFLPTSFSRAKSTLYAAAAVSDSF